MNDRPLTPFEIQRRALGVMDDLRQKPALYISLHRGVYGEPGQNKKTAQPSTFQGNAFHPQENIVVDLSEGLPIGFRELLEGFLERSHREDSAAGDQRQPGHILNLIYLPPLEENGWAKGPSESYGLDYHNFQSIFDKLEASIIDSFPTRNAIGLQPLRDDSWYVRLTDCLPSLGQEK